MPIGGAKVERILGKKVFTFNPDGKKIKFMELDDLSLGNSKLHYLRASIYQNDESIDGLKDIKQRIQWHLDVMEENLLGKFLEEAEDCIIRGHLYESGFSLGYLDWIWHGEGVASSTQSSVGSTCPGKKPAPPSETYNVCQATYNDNEDWDKESDDFKRYVADAKQPLFEGSECTKLESVLKLHHWKARFGVSDKTFTDLLESIGSFLLKEHVLPGSMYKVKKTLTDLGLEYVKIHACPNDCVLYRGPAADPLSECPKCHLSRWKIVKDGKVRVNVPAKVMWYFSIIPRFKRLFKSAATAKLLSWHAENRFKDGKMRHPSDSPTWQNVDCRWPEFSSEARNIRLGLVADGINPHNYGLNNRYSCWPVM
ncbi:uncharacterized protein LOC141705544 [Apium graveolens]|uniref:uncharacterized protein LOC141705544 n=1 Tax=Apium graveolens TaxID=4045 RepID=UPI003D7924B9